MMNPMNTYEDDYQRNAEVNRGHVGPLSLTIISKLKIKKTVIIVLIFFRVLQSMCQCKIFGKNKKIE
jgi:hypothetical protein